MSKKTYMRRVFGGKDVPAIGIDQGKGIAYRGSQVPFCLNLIYSTSLMTRIGSKRNATYSGTIIEYLSGSANNSLAEGTNAWSEQR